MDIALSCLLSLAAAKLLGHFSSHFLLPLFTFTSSSPTFSLVPYTPVLMNQWPHLLFNLWQRSPTDPAAVKMLQDLLAWDPVEEIILSELSSPKSFILPISRNEMASFALWLTSELILYREANAASNEPESLNNDFFIWLLKLVERSPPTLSLDAIPFHPPMTKRVLTETKRVGLLTALARGRKRLLTE